MNYTDKCKKHETENKKENENDYHRFRCRHGGATWRQTFV